MKIRRLLTNTVVFGLVFAMTFTLLFSSMAVAANAEPEGGELEAELNEVDMVSADPSAPDESEQKTELPETEIYIDHEDEASAYGRLVINVFLEAVEENPNLTVYLISDEGGDEDVLTPEEEAEIINSLFDDEE